MSESSTKTDLARYERQMRYAPLGEAGQRKLSQAKVLVCGVGALGSMIANTIVRSGVGFVRLVDRDFVELSNLQRQVLYDEQDVANNLPKAIAAATKLQRINSAVRIEPIVTDVDHANIERLAEGVDMIVDGTDNFEIRFLLNDVAVKHKLPWVYGGCLGAEGQSMTILPGETACLRCLMPETPPPGSTPTCDTAGILSPIISVIASLEAMEAIKVLSGNRQAVNRTLMVIDVWENRVRQIKLDSLREQSDCACCKHGEFDWLSGSRASQTAVLCGRNAVQLHPPAGGAAPLDQLEQKLAVVGTVMRNPFLLRANVESYVLTVFRDGRAIIGGTDDIPTARGVYAKYIGN
jgi:molybdopterin-synthase adenylyltransferase